MPLEIMDYTDTKFDFLVTEICDKITTCLHLLQKDGEINEKMSLKEMYNTYLHPDKIDMTDEKIWNGLNSGTVMDVFQFNTGVGLAAVKQAKPHSLTEMISTNALIRLMPEQGRERPLDRYSRLKKDMNLWYKEVRERGLTEEEIKILEPYYLPRYGVPCSQEDLMRVCIDPKIAHFTLGEANYARKVVAKKQIKKVPELKKKFIDSCASEKLGQYVWETTMEPQMSYAFSDIHASVYSMVGIQTLYLATHFPSIYWNCACLIVNAGGVELLNADDFVEEEDGDSQKRTKNKTVNYGKISTAISETKNKGILILPPDINNSDLIFKPDSKRNAIIYGMKGITRIGTPLVYEIFKKRPYSDLNDFLAKVKVNKVQMVNLIKSGAFDNVCNCSRQEIMKMYLLSVADQKKRITLQNMQMLIEKRLIPIELDFERRLFNFNRYLKKSKVNNDYYELDSRAMNFFTNYYDENMLENVQIQGNYMTGQIKQNKWDNLYKKGMNPMRDWMKKNQENILKELNTLLFKETFNKYAGGTISYWEMESLGFYYHNHELSNLANDIYNINDYKSLPTEPVVKNTFKTKNNDEIKIFKIARIAGTVIDKDKNHNTITLLTTSGTVPVKIWKNQFAIWDKQISEKNEDGTKHVVEKSWFTKGNKLIITGIRRDDFFIPKKYKNTEYPLFEKIISINDKGIITESITERPEIEE